jgi:hypothetical protein
MVTIARSTMVRSTNSRAAAAAADAATTASDAAGAAVAVAAAAVAAAAAAAAAVAAAATDLIGLWRTWQRIVACSGRSAGRLVASTPRAGKSQIGARSKQPCK